MPLPPAILAAKYPPAAFLFVRRGLDHAANKIHGEGDAAQPAESRHITGRQLCIGLRDFAIEEYGLLALPTLARWRIRSTEDFGNIVFLLVEAKQLTTTEGDSIRDFIDVYRFEDEFPTRLQLPDA